MANYCRAGIKSLRGTLEIFLTFDVTQVFLMGGSHGGFLVTHLAGQYPDQYQVSSSPTLPLPSFSRPKRSVLLSFIFQGRGGAQSRHQHCQVEDQF
jgi:hypothetical protein